jgi:hypothetical protein
MTLATGVGSWPGDDTRDYAEAVRVVLGEADLPYLPELPGRGAAAGMVGRTLAMVGDLGFDLQPAGWRLTDTSGVDHRRARSLLAQDLDHLEEQAQDVRGTFKIQVAGPWTLAAAVEKPRGDKVLSDHGARRELAQALAEGVATHLADVRRRVAAERVVAPVGRAGSAGRAVRCSPDRLRLREAPRRPPTRGLPGARVGARDGRSGAVGALVRAGGALGVDPRRRRTRAQR